MRKKSSLWLGGSGDRVGHEVESSNRNQPKRYFREEEVL